jgi:L-alanine-DL-glutamate epimerase-like enolase superfamily enzyme
LIGRSALAAEGIYRDVADALAATDRDGAIGRAWSLLEIGLHDLRSQAVGWPLWQLLGGWPRRVPIQIVEGYALVGESDDAFAERLAARAAEGFRLIKIEAAHYQKADELLSRLAAFRRRAGDGPQLVLDFVWAWKDVKSKQRLLDALADLGIAWIEDSFDRTAVDRYRELRGASRVAIGCGDEATRQADLLALIEGGAVDVIRADATTVGGIAAVRRVTETAAAHGIRASLHEHPEVHEHCVFGFGASDHVELFPKDRPFDVVHRLWHETLTARISNGELEPGTLPGTGIRLNDDAVRHYAIRHDAVGCAA